MKIGIVIGRFQVPVLHEGHEALLDKVFNDNDRTVVFIGSVNVPRCSHNPLSYWQRLSLFEDHYAVDSIYPLPDMPKHDDWSANVDDVIKRLVCIDGFEEVTLYCGRDGFKKYYNGEFTVVEIEEVSAVSGTEMRRTLKPAWSDYNIIEDIIKWRSQGCNIPEHVR